LALPLVSQMALLPQSPLVLWKVTVLWSSLMMTARFRPVLPLAFRHTPHHLRRPSTFCLVSYWRLMGRACGLGMGQSMRRERECVLRLGHPLPPWSHLVITLSRLLLQKTMLLRLTRVGLQKEVP
jgi:hypothetical protein